MERYIKNILAQVVVVAALFFGTPGCTPNKVVVDQGASTIEVQRDSEGATSVRVTPRGDSNSARPTPAAPTPTVVVTDQKPQIDAAQRELAGLQAQMAGVRRELVAAVKERDQAVNARDKAAADLEQAQRAAVALNRQIEQLGTAKASLEKELADLTSRRDKTRAEVTENQRAAETLMAEIKRLTAAKATTEQELAATAGNLGKAKDTLASVSADVAGREKQLAAIKKPQTETEAAVAVAQAALESVKADTAKATVNLDNVRSQVEAKQRELASLAAQATESSGNAMTQPARAAETSTPTVNSLDGGQIAPTATPSERGSPTQADSDTGSPQAKSSDESQAPLAPAAGTAPTWRTAALGAAAVLGLAAIVGLFMVWLAPRGSYTCLLHSLKTGQDVSQAVRRARESVVMTADGAATMTPVECLHPGDTYLGVNAFGSPVLSVGDGVSLNGETLSAGSRIKLQPGARISVGPNAVFEFRSCLRSDARDESETAMAA